MFFSIYLDTVSNNEPQLLATPKLSNLLHTYFTKNDKRLQLAGCHRIHIQLTTISRWREAVPCDSKMANSGRPVKGFTQNLIVQTK